MSEDQASDVRVMADTAMATISPTFTQKTDDFLQLRSDNPVFADVMIPDRDDGRFKKGIDSRRNLNGATGADQLAAKVEYSYAERRAVSPKEWSRQTKRFNALLTLAYKKRDLAAFTAMYERLGNRLGDKPGVRSDALATNSIDASLRDMFARLDALPIGSAGPVIDVTPSDNESNDARVAKEKPSEEGKVD